MINVQELVMTIVKPLVTQPQAVTIAQSETARLVELKLSVAPQDVGRVIGKQGQVAQAIRTLLANVDLPNHKRIRLQIVDA
ncbi:MAG: KH domain-containing protein [Candidatus Paralactobacillus gallistercoris]|uniref:RNA-binding protein KhpA n=1 Tax=Candidatus Paralactobacillus gallistercoris TaxID=2838724 RepID=A0A948X0Q2_9LACO|nr:KH domain-containing protein [Candidatus Paralactobacillus gallistercoris]